jgi:hypothetical protein
MYDSIDITEFYFYKPVASNTIYYKPQPLIKILDDYVR